MIKSILKLLIPNSILSFRVKRAEKKRHSLYRNLPIADIFKNIYTNHEWGAGNGEFYSGSGTHNIDITKPYIEAVIGVLKSLPNKPIMVDIGSGDFNIGNNFVEFVDYYYACDIVPLLQAHNRKIFNFSNVSFVCVDATKDDIPDGDILIIRQVLQHLSNKDIQKIIDKCNKFDKWIVTEHIPNHEDFIPNKDISTGCGIRVLFNSGVVLSEPPFSIKGYNESILCESYENNGIIRTTFYEKNKIV